MSGVRIGLVGIILLAASALLLGGCDGIDERSENGGDGGRGGSEGIVLEKLEFSQSPPSIITIFFRAKDGNGRPVATLTNDDFEVLENDQPVSPTETWQEVVPRDALPYSLETVILLDTSNSIASNPENLEKMKAAVKSLVVDSEGNSVLLPQQRIAVYTFSDFERNETPTEVRAFSSNAQGLAEAIDAIPTPIPDATNLYGAVRYGVSLWSDQFDTSRITQGQLIVVTDGSDTTNRFTLNEALQAIGDKSVFTIAIGNELSPDVLQQLGTAGRFRLDNFDQLQATLAAVTQEISDLANSFYYLHYASPKRAAGGDRSNSNHTLTLRVKNNKNTADDAVIGPETFNSFEFTRAIPQVAITGPTTIEVGQQADYTARTRWTHRAGSYSWEVTGACDQLGPTGDSYGVRGSVIGECELIATDNNNNGISSNIVVTVTE